MNTGKYVFSQIVEFLPKRYFEGLIINCKDRTVNMTPSYWIHLFVIMYGQLKGCRSLRELTDITSAHWKRSFHLDFGKTLIKCCVACLFSTKHRSENSLKGKKKWMICPNMIIVNYA